ncbi:YybH family protein [Formosa maritima]|uniref:Nuclear transport factor 2 family protein n=1 Tax=Formosa maritima TaxID=2592046 RepID=A0A5D0G2C7_9FLAO|nr:nuclear transport factor 2 family protein [Formosa maritima]TYA53076.1 nuclear transport factor 2 family protein [Formosa maritima]
MKTIYILLFLISSTICVAQSNENQDKEAILTVMKLQEEAWNKHNLVGFMQGNWKSESLKFYGGNGLTLGWENTLSNYKKGYPTKAETGTLKFVINDISKIEGESYWVIGEYHLTRDVGNANGVFIIIFKKIKGEWKIIADMSC